MGSGDTVNRTKYHRQKAQVDTVCRATPSTGREVDRSWQLIDQGRIGVHKTSASSWGLRSFCFQTYAVERNPHGLSQAGHGTLSDFGEHLLDF
jgi:hypothetical protein